MKPLDGAKLKIVRAQKHLDCLKAEIGAYLNCKPYTIEAYRENGGVIHIGPTTITVEPPLELGCIFGDCLNNLRSSLDYVAWELATKFAPTDELKRIGTGVHFPLAKTAGHFASNGRPQLVALQIPAPTIALIESIQPYQAGYESLGVLNELIKTDKHRLPLLTIATADTDSITVADGGILFTLEFSDTPSGLPIAKPLPHDSPEALRIRERIREVQTKASVLSVVGQQPRNVNVDGQVTVFVSLKDFPMPNEPIDVTLSNIFKCVSDIIPRFEPSFV